MYSLEQALGPYDAVVDSCKTKSICNLQRARSKKRRAAVKELWASDGVLWTADGTYIGHKAVEKAAVSILRNYPDYSPVGSTDEIPDAARMQWSLGTAGGRPALSGLDVIVVSDGCIVAMYRFLDGAEL